MYLYEVKFRGRVSDRVAAMMVVAASTKAALTAAEATLKNSEIVHIEEKTEIDIVVTS